MPESETITGPTLRICFPLRVQRGDESWWEFEEYQIRFRDIVMWRQAFYLPETPGMHAPLSQPTFTRVQRTQPQLESEQNAAPGEVSIDQGARGSAPQLDPIPRSHWSYSISEQTQENSQESLQFHLSLSSQESRTVNTLQSDAAEIVGNPSNDTSHVLNEIIALYRLPGRSSISSQPSLSHQNVQQIEQPESVQSLATPQPTVPTQPSDINTGNSVGQEPFQGHRAQTLRILEGNITPVQDIQDEDFRVSIVTILEAIYYSTIVQACVITLRRLKAWLVSAVAKRTPQQRSVRVSRLGWAGIRNIILSGLTEADRAAFPAYTEDQEAAFWVVEDEGCVFDALWRQNLETCSLGEAMEALELLQARGWRDVIFISYEDTPRLMQSWVRSAKASIFPWGQNMI